MDKLETTQVGHSTGDVDGEFDQLLDSWILKKQVESIPLLYKQVESTHLFPLLNK